MADYVIFYVNHKKNEFTIIIFVYVANMNTVKYFLFRTLKVPIFCIYLCFSFFFFILVCTQNQVSKVNLRKGRDKYHIKTFAVVTDVIGSLIFLKFPQHSEEIFFSYWANHGEKKSVQYYSSES